MTLTRRTLADAITEGQGAHHEDRAFRVCLNPATGDYSAIGIRCRVPSNLTLLGHVVLRAADNTWGDAPGNPRRLLPGTAEAAAAAAVPMTPPRPRPKPEASSSNAATAFPGFSPTEARIAHLCAQGCTFEAVLVATGYKRQALINLCSRLRAKMDLPAPLGRIPHDQPGSGWDLLGEALRERQTVDRAEDDDE